jgi:hypothetical protein
MKTAGEALREDFDSALEKASQRIGKRLQWDEHELASLNAAADAATKRDQLQQIYDAELAGERRPRELVRLSIEMRLLGKAIQDHLGRVRVGPGIAKSERHQRAVNACWQRHRETREA